jgi:hypothetical protein
MNAAPANQQFRTVSATHTCYQGTPINDLLQNVHSQSARGRPASSPHGEPLVHRADSADRPAGEDDHAAGGAVEIEGS